MDTGHPASQADSLSGLVERVTFFNEETGFAVLRVKVKGHRDLVTVVGQLPSATPGEWLVAEGKWTQNREHGRQFQAARLTCTPPTTREGIEKYLGSGMVKGIGPVYAKKLVARFGEQIFDIIDQYSAKLEQVDGIGPGRRRKIKSAWAEQKFIREIMVFLHSHGVGTSRAVRIYKVYGEEAIDKVRTNPYLLARDIPGIGFKTADQIARQVGIPPDSVLRAKAGLLHALAEATSAGHCALPQPALFEAAAKLLGVNESIIQEAFQQLLASREIIREQVQKDELVFFAYLHFAEKTIAERIRFLAGQRPNYPAIDLDKAIAWRQDKAGFDLAPTQREAIRIALQNRAVVLTGGPGVGKTTLIQSILQILRAKNIKPLLCAPTGRAAKRLGESTGLEAQTIHRLLEVQSSGRGFGRNETRPLEADLLVVDECSMVDVPLMQALLRAHPPEAGLILAGDVDQLPSVGPGAVLGDLINSQAIPVLRLTEIFRQAAASRIITAAHSINRGHFPVLPDKGEESDFHFIEREHPDQILQTLLDMVKTRIPRKLNCDPVQDIQVLAPMNRGSLGVRELNVQLQNELNPARPDEPSVEKFGWQFRPRDKVIQTQNNYDKEVFNGDIGHIQQIDLMEREIVIRFDSREVTYDFGELDEIALAYAITIHKAQGSEFPAVVIPLASQHYLMLQRNLVYTGITRGKQLVILIGQRKALSMAIRNNLSSRRWSGLLDRLRSGAGAGAR